MAAIARKAQTLETGIRATENIIRTVGMYMLLIMMFLGAGDVIGRYAFNNPIFGAMDFSQLLMGIVVFFGWAYTLSERAHVTVDIVFRRYPPRAQAIISFVTLFLSLVLFSLIVWQAVNVAMVDWHTGRLVKIILIPVAPFKFIFAFGAFLLCLECIIQMVHLIPGMSGKKEG